MKKIFKLLSFLAIASIFAVSCKKEAQYTPGEEDITGCYGVYFPAQTLPTILDPTQDPVVNITVKRKNSTGDIIVPVEVQGDEVFELAPILFADGQDETTVKLFFDKAELGVNYKVSIGVTDPKFASKYASNPASIDYSVLRVSYYYFGCKNGKETKEVDPANATKVSWYSPFWGEYFTGIIKYYETNGLRTCVTVTDPERFDIAKQAWYNTGKGFFGTTGDEFEFLWDTKTKKLYYEPCPVWNHATYGMIYMADYYGWYVGLTGKISISGPIEFYTEYKENFKDFMSEYDGNGGFNFFVCGYSWKGTTGSGFAFPEDIDLFGVADGFIRVDYSIEAEAGLTQDGVTPVAFTTGADVAKVVYANYEGVLSATQISNAVTAIVEGKVPSAQSVVPEEGEAAVGVTLDATGVYTLVAVSYDKDSNAQESTSTTFTYVSPTDPVPVVISTGLGSAEKYREVSTDTALELYIFGDDIVDAKCTLIDEPTVISKGVDACISKLLATKSLSATAIEAINGDGYVGVATGLLPGTKYYSFVWASNGFEENVFISDPYSTTGEPKPIYKNFTADDLKNLPETSDKYFGTYNYYAVDYNDENGNTLRQYLGKVTISDSDIPDSGPDEEGLIDEYVNISGFFGRNIPAFIASDTLVFDFYDGVLYYLKGQTLPKGSRGYDGVVWVGDSSKGDEGWGYDVNFAFVGGYVDDGYIAFVPYPAYISKGYTFDGICAYMYKDGTGVGFLENLYNLLLVDPAKDDNQVSGKALKGIGNLHAAAATVKDAPLVLKPEERVAWAKAKVERESLANELAKAGVIVSHTGRAVDFTSSESSFKKVNNAKPTEIKKFAGQRNIF